MLLEGIGEDPDREGLKDTPERIGRMYAEILAGMDMQPGEILSRTFSSDNTEIVLEKDIPFYSMCEHHLVPFFGKVSIAYKPHEGSIAGFSKFTRMVEIISHRPQLQERMTEDIARAVEQGLKADGVLVIVEAQQLCMIMRGDMAHGSKTITSSTRGCFKSDRESYHQAWNMLGWDNNE